MTPHQTRHILLDRAFPEIPHDSVSQQTCLPDHTLSRDTSWLQQRGLIHHWTPLTSSEQTILLFLTLGLCQSRGAAAATQIQAHKETLTSGFGGKKNCLLALSLVFGLLRSLLTRFSFLYILMLLAWWG